MHGGHCTITVLASDVAWTKAVRSVLDIPYGIHSYLIPRDNELQFFDEICRRYIVYEMLQADESVTVEIMLVFALYYKTFSM